MTVNELIVELKKMDISGDEQITVHAFGGIGTGAHPVETVLHGFDWDKGKVVLHCKYPLILKKFYDEVVAKQIWGKSPKGKTKQK